MLSPHVFSTLWGEERLLRVPRNLLQGIAVPNNAKSFLIEAGFPKSAELLYRTHLTLLPLTQGSASDEATNYALLSPSPFGSAHYRLLACFHHESDWLTRSYIAVEEGTGHIYKVGPPVQTDCLDKAFLEEHNRFVNSSIPQLAEFLLVYREFLANFAPIEPERDQVPVLIASLERKWQEIDHKAMSEAEYEWPMMIYDMGIHL